jgi:hypothetical protein
MSQLNMSPHCTRRHTLLDRVARPSKKRSRTIFFAAFFALGVLICETGRDGMASPGCNAVNAGVFNVSTGAISNKTVSDFAVGDNITFLITSSSSGSWILRTASFANLDGSPIFAKNESQAKSYTVTGSNQDTTLTQYSGGAAVKASCAATATRPTVTSITPTNGPASGGTIVTINGSGFTGVTSVNFGSDQASYVFNGDTLITGTAPAGSGVTDVTVTTPGGTSVSSTVDEFTYTTGAPDVPTFTILPRPDPRRRPLVPHPKMAAPTTSQSPAPNLPVLGR